MIPAAIAQVGPGTFLAIVAASALAASLAVFAASRGVVIHVVVIELILGILIGPDVAGLHPTELVTFFADLGLGLLFFFAGYEIDLKQIAGKPLRLGILGWCLSLVIAYSVGAALAAAGIVLSLLYTGSALSTTRSECSSRCSRTSGTCALASAPSFSPLARSGSSGRSSWSP